MLKFNMVLYLIECHYHLKMAGYENRVFTYFSIEDVCEYPNVGKKDYVVHAPKIKWTIDEKAEDKWDGWFDIETNIGDRRTDIVIENYARRLQTIIDAKYYANMLIKKYHNQDDVTYRTAHINQVRGYLLDSTFEGDKVGALVYPTVDYVYQRGTVLPIADANIIVKTINLNDDWKKIESDLLLFVEKIERTSSSS